ncbi:MAG: trypsin-like peptidase domain-containing protein [Planctomycetaceae bacterium]|nr:trypsin-like peptidase domain-containing protein [Planctomycetaceae bacterium]
MFIYKHLAIGILCSFLLSVPLFSAEDSGGYDKSVVMIMSVSQDYDYATPWKKAAMSRGVGSGLVIEGNRILTNAHNVSNQCYIELKKQNSAKRYPAQVLFTGHDCDLALLTVPDTSFFEGMEPLQFGGIPLPNSSVQTCGFPMGGRQVSVTKGVVSRVETGVYSHSQASQHLVIQTDAAINPGNSGGPVLQDGKVVGVAFQGLQSGDNIGYLIPTTIIGHFLKDIADGKYDGFGTFGISLYPGLHNPSYKQYLKIPSNQEGVVISDILSNSSAREVFQKGDVLTNIDGYGIENDGRVTIDGLSLELGEIMDRKQIGETVAVTFYRDGQKMQKELKVAANEPILPWRLLFDNQPQYRVFAGLTFVQLNRNYLQAWGREWISDIPFPLRYLFIDYNQLNKSPARQEYVLLSEILPDEVNAYLEGFKRQPVESVNGIEINSLSDLDKAFEKDVEGFWVVKFLFNESPMIVDAVKARQQQKAIIAKYNVNASDEVF